MLTYLFKAAFRNLMKYKLNAIIIILSLAFSFSCSNILLSFIIHELNTDAFNPKKDRIYRLLSDDPFEEGSRIRYIPAETAHFLKDNYPEVEEVCNIATLGPTGIALIKGEQLFKDVNVLGVDSNFIQLFDYPIIEGNTTSPFVTNGIVLIQQMAQKLLTEPPYVGRMLDLQQDSLIHPLKVTAVLSDPTENTHLTFDALVLHSSIQKQGGGSTYCLLSPHADKTSLIEKINNNAQVPSLIGPGKVAYFMEPFRNVYFGETKPQPYEKEGNALLIWISWLVVFLISFAASFNFVNLFIIGLMNRKKEIGMKKVLGASKVMIGLGLGIEVSLYVILSLFLSGLIITQLLPFFNAAFNTSLTLSYLLHQQALLLIGLLVGSLILIIAAYLTFYSWRLNTVSLLYNKKFSKLRVNRLLTIMQFIIAAGMIFCTIIILQQIHFIENKPLGFNRHLLEIASPSDQPVVKDRLSLLKQKLSAHQTFSHIALASGNPISGNWVMRQELEDKTFYSPYLLSGDEDLMETLQLTLLEGRPLHASDQGKLVNEAFVRYFNMESPVGATIPGTQDKIAGVVKDFNSVSLRQEIPPYIISYNENGGSLLVDISGKRLQDLLPVITQNWQEVYPDYIFDYKLISDELLIKHQEDLLFFRMIISFTIVSILISVFGLFGIASFTASQRTKEIGIRKVMGASVSNILVLLSKEYIKLILIAFAIAIPIANFFIAEWLQSFVYHISISWWMFALPGLIVLFLALLAVSRQSLKAAVQNPVDSLRNE